ncbi:putative signal transducing protein [Maribellus maritimus]|uniref:putative signal transducing protein n=1 Tax=Maribellus maritimus TaxID=2870838 RepID=UPI001EE9EC45|nr:DUF2007 domain-containing protein [Maribellus maritimus]MCG6190414.1 DUF2007 domain-containing protein [Maribellus maritimus]
MKNSGRLILIYTGGEVIIQRLKAELEQKGINSIIKDRFKEGIAAGFVDGVPSAIRLFVNESDAEKALEVVKAIVD